MVIDRSRILLLLAKKKGESARMQDPDDKLNDGAKKKKKRVHYTDHRHSPGQTHELRNAVTPGGSVAGIQQLGTTPGNYIASRCSVIPVS